jgi:5-methylcytosine-specific restriction endonuclease McrA
MECGYQYTLDRLAKKRIENHQEVECICKECGSVFVPEFGNKHRAFCSDDCCKKYSGRVSKASRRARIRCTKQLEYFDPIEILRRDKWHCQLCGVKTPKHLRGTIDDYAPELDHIVPLAMGGSHTRANTQCLCRKCNQKKGASVIGQLRLLG